MKSSRVALGIMTRSRSVAFSGWRSKEPTTKFTSRNGQSGLAKSSTGGPMWFARSGLADMESVNVLRRLRGGRMCRS